MDYPPFVDAIARFRSFLDEQGHRSPIRWVFESDVLLFRGGWIIRARANEIVTNEIASAYIGAVNQRLGVLFDVLCVGDHAIWCYIFCPKNLDQAERCLMPDGLKLNVPINPQQSREVTNDAEWANLKEREAAEQKSWVFEK